MMPALHLLPIPRLLTDRCRLSVAAGTKIRRWRTPNQHPGADGGGGMEDARLSDHRHCAARALDGWIRS
jgi:hypothetical protein